MRRAVPLAIILFLSAFTFTNASAFQADPIATINATFDSTEEATVLHITLIQTNDGILLDELKQATWSLFRDGSLVQQDIQLCTISMMNSECSGAEFNITYLPPEGSDGIANYHLEASNPSYLSSSIPVAESVSPIVAVENLAAIYSNEITTLSWNYPAGIAMNHSVMIYSHDYPATRANWNSLTKTIVSSSVAPGTTSYEINYTGESVERDIFYSVTLLYETSEDARFLGSNTLLQAVWEDNTAPLFIGELSATFNPDFDTTTIDWNEGLEDDDLVINIYRSDIKLERLDTNNLVASVDASTTSHELLIPIGEHRQSWYAITLEDSEGNEILELTESSPTADPIIETTTTSPSISDISAERFGDGTITISWEDNTQNPNTIARIWRSIEGPIESLENVQELTPTNASAGQFSHNPLDASDQVWYAITIEGSWGSSAFPWHFEELNLGMNSMSSSFRETENTTVVEPSLDILVQVQSTTGAGAAITDGSWITLGAMYEGDIIIISTSRVVDNISCNDINGQGSVIYSESDWGLSFNANQTSEKCIGTIADGDDEIGFTLNWNYIETIADNSNNTSTETDDDDDDGDGEKHGQEGHDEEDKGTVASIILAIIILALLVYLLVMMRSPNYEEEE